MNNDDVIRTCVDGKCQAFLADMDEWRKKTSACYEAEKVVATLPT